MVASTRMKMSSPGFIESRLRLWRSRLRLSRPLSRKRPWLLHPLHPDRQNFADVSHRVCRAVSRHVGQAVPVLVAEIDDVDGRDTAVEQGDVVIQHPLADAV